MENIYKRAARKIHAYKEKYSCIAVLHIDTSVGSCYVLYTRVMKKSRKVLTSLAVEDAANEIGISAREFRLMLLSMMSACYKDFVRK